MIPGEMADSRIKAGTVYFAVSEYKDRDKLEGHKSQLEWDPAGQIKDNLSIKITMIFINYNPLNTIRNHESIQL